jgi:predicted MFS family arabinose efflux permease
MLPSALLLALRPSAPKRSLQPMVLVIFALATGMTFGPSIGGWLNGLLGWRWLFRGIALLAALLFLCYLIKNWRDSARGLAVYRMKAAARSKSNWKRSYSYTFIYLTGVFHSGVFVWISYYFSTQYGLDEFQIATELFIFGLPGFLLTLVMYFFQMDKKVLRTLYIALGVTGACLSVFLQHLPLWLAECVLGIMSLGFGCSQPLFIGLLKMPRADVSPVGPVAKGSGLLFGGYGSGPLIIIPLLELDLNAAMLFLILLLLALAYISRRVWKF